MKSPSILLAGVTCTAAALLVAAHPAAAASSAEVSEIVKDVSISGRQASLGDTLSGNTALKTGTRSRAELTFEDTTLLRVGSNTVFSFLGTYLQITKVLESWLYWLVINLASVWLYQDRGLEIYAVLMGLYSILSVYGFLRWRKSYRSQLDR